MAGRRLTAAQPKASISGPTKIFLVAVILIAGIYMFGYIYHNVTASQSANLSHQPLTITDEIENVPAGSRKGLNYNFPLGGKLDITVNVANGNPIDIFLTNADQLDVMNKGDWRNVKAYSNFNATKARTYHRSEFVGPGNYCLVLRDTTLGVLSAHASDVSVKTVLTP